ncbi:MAG: RNA-guided pseudouridylation complex pseudouridine synthase subunit Cbf5 [Nanoarchaeota archaeon]
MNLPFEELDRTIKIKQKVAVSKEFGFFPEDRKIEELLNCGMICLNKPQGPTSHQVIDYIKKILNIPKAGHTGTLDPHVSGVLPIALNNATKITQALLPAEKEYVALMYLHSDIPEEKIKNELQKYTGTINQLPPVRSAVKRQLRQRNVYYIDVLEIKGRHVLFKIGCQGGTYVRKYIHDFGKILNTDAHMKELVRTKVGFFSSKEWCSLHDLKDAFTFYQNGDSTHLKKLLLPIEAGVRHLPKVYVLDSAICNLCHGSPLYVGGVSKVEACVETGLLVAVMSLKNELVCLGISMLTSSEIKNNKKGVAVKTTKVFMNIGIYPGNA